MKFLSLAIALGLATQLVAEPLVCTDPLLTVTGGDKATRERTCATASKARKTLESCGANLQRPIEIAIVKAFDPQYTSCLGLYHCGEDRIEILSPTGLAAERDKDGAFELVSDDAYWQSIIAHELTHAVFDTVECPFPNCPATAEYAAYAMQVFSLPEDQQALFGQTVTINGDVNSTAISAIMLYMRPERFAKYVWLHFQSQEAPCDYIQYIMDGQIFFDRELH